MFCDRCGTQVISNSAQCASCGRTFPNVPLLPVEDRLDGHMRLLGILWLALSALRLLPGVVLVIAAKVGIQSFRRIFLK
jgi:predicted lysophospholipase L1 biosynthesis ABC-type transport system permease subunit